MNRQQKRQAERRFAKDRFPFPQHIEWLRRFLKLHPDCYAWMADDKIETNLSGCDEVLSLSEFNALLDATKVGFENEERTR